MVYDHAVDCGIPLVNRNVKLNYNSTLDGSILILTCENETPIINITDEQILIVICHNNGNWIPNPAEFTCSSGISLVHLYLHVYQVVLIITI